ncbi:MAG: MOSC domain-containing protein [Anaerolineales bacterium]
MQVVSINLGRPQTCTYFGREVETGGHKQPVAEAFLRQTGFDGDGQADLKNHGGPDKAVCVYVFDHYPFWEQWLGQTLAPGAFSENLTLSGAPETEVCIGDVWQVGAARLQVCQPRMPCSKLAGRRDSKALPAEIHTTGYSGYYLRVLQEGMVRAGDTIEVIARDPASVTVQFINELFYRQRTDRTSFDRALAVEALTEAGRWMLMKRLNG